MKKREIHYTEISVDMRGLQTVTYAEISDILCPKCKKVAEEALLLLPPFLREGFKESAYLTGSSLVQMLHDKPVKDYDFYFKDEKYAEKVKNFFILSGNTKPESDYMYTEYRIKGIGFVTVTTNSVTIMTHEGSFQFIHRKSGNPREIIFKFDFAHDLSFYDVGQDNLTILTMSAKLALSEYKLAYNTTTDINPFATIKRLAKFLSRGMECDERNLNRLMCYLYERIKEDNIEIDNDCTRGES